MDLDFKPTIWKEDLPASDAAGYEKCEVCTGRSRIIWGEGNPKAPIMVILDNPGEREDKEGNEYICGTRQTLQRGIHEVNLKQENIYLTYLLKCRPTKKYDKERARLFSRPYLTGQIERANPKFLVFLGDTVVQSLFNDTETSVKKLRGRWHVFMDTLTMVSYHPLAVRRRPNLMNIFLKDWEMLAQRIST